MHEPIDILLAQKFLPQFGGSISWMYQVYRRWPLPVDVVTHDYYNVALGTPEFPDVAVKPASGDHVTDENLHMDRRDIFINDWGLENLGRLRRYWRMNRAIKQRLKRAKRGQVVRVHCIHAVPEAVSLIPLKWRYGKRLKLICYAHGEEVTACESSRQLKILMRQAHKAVDLMIANSENTMRLLANHIAAEKVKVINPGVEISEFDQSEDAGARYRKAHGLEDKLIVLTLARMDRRKNQLAVMKAVAGLKDRYPNLVYIVAGGGVMAEELKKQAGELGIGDRTIFPGEVDGETRIGLYGCCDVFAMPAIQVGTDVEGFGMVFIEAGACGKPSIAGDAGGQPEAVADGESGFVVDGNDFDAVTKALNLLLSNEPLRQQMGIKARERAQLLDWPNVVQRTVELVDKL